MNKKKKQTLPEIDNMTANLALLFMEDENEYDRKYPQWAIDEELKRYGTTVIRRAGKGLVYAVYDYSLNCGLNEKDAVKAVRDRILFNKTMGY